MLRTVRALNTAVVKHRRLRVIHLKWNWWRPVVQRALPVAWLEERHREIIGTPLDLKNPVAALADHDAREAVSKVGGVNVSRSDEPTLSKHVVRADGFSWLEDEK
jgi:hypothetical protein